MAAHAVNLHTKAAISWGVPTARLRTSYRAITEESPLLRRAVFGERPSVSPRSAGPSLRQSHRAGESSVEFVELARTTTALQAVEGAWAPCCNRSVHPGTVLTLDDSFVSFLVTHLGTGRAPNPV